MDVVKWWILENKDARRHFDIAFDQLQNRATCRTEGVMVDQRPVDISETT